MQLTVMSRLLSCVGMVYNDTLGPGLGYTFFHSQSYKKPACDTLSGRFRVNLVWTCEICAIDLRGSSQAVGGIGRVIALTTWKNLGAYTAGSWQIGTRKENGSLCGVRESSYSSGNRSVVYSLS